MEEKRRFIEAGGNTTHAFGLGRLIGRVYALIYLSPAAVPLEEIATQLAISKASASIVLRQLASLHAVRLEVRPTDRRDFYQAETNFSTILNHGLLPGIRKKLHSAGVQIQRTLAADPANPSAVAASVYTRDQQAEIRRRLKSAQTLHRRLDRLLASKLLARFL